MLTLFHFLLSRWQLCNCRSFGVTMSTCATQLRGNLDSRLHCSDCSLGESSLLSLSPLRFPNREDASKRKRTMEPNDTITDDVLILTARGRGEIVDQY